jgi:Ca2+-binding RTX toxin-like protein
VYVGTDDVAGADVTVILSGLFTQGQFALANETIGLQIVAVAEAETLAPVISQAEPQPVFRSLGAGSTQYLVPETYQGPLDLDYQLIDNTPNAVLIGSAFNDFIKLGGSGNKAVDGAGGADVIDGGTGSTFISGGGVGQADTFFLDGRASGVSWSTITDFELGVDKGTIWGWKQGVSRVSNAFSDVDSGGAAGFTGLTLHIENLLPDGSAQSDRNASLNSITLTDLRLSDFGASTIEQLNAQILAGTNPHFLVGSVTDAFGEHGYLYIS